jgi:bacillithiol biosynthesis deacetylase BshB1
MLAMPALDVLALAAHPDDVELCAGGIMCLLQAQGYRTGIVDFTRGELGTRGTPEGRMDEARRASEILGLSARDNLGLPDGHIENTPETQRAVIERVRRYRPSVVLVNALHVRHPDHGDAARLSIDALYYAGLAKIETAEADGTPQAPWRPHHVLHYIQALDVEPTFVVDVSSVWERRMEAMLAFRSQFYTGGADGGTGGADGIDAEGAGAESDGAEVEGEGAEGPETYISNPDFLAWVEARARTLGHRVGAQYGEGLVYRHGPVGVGDLMQVLGHEKPFR